MHRFRGAVAAVAAGTLILLTATPAFAHEQRTVGAYQLTVGWQHEPTYAGTENAVQIFIKDSKGKPVDDIGDPPTVQLQVISGNQTSDPLPLVASFDADTGEGTHGEFDATILPTRPGAYTFHFTGAIAGQKIDEKFTASDTTFDVVKDPTAIEFPAKDPTNGALATSIDKLSPRVDAATAAAKKSNDKAKTATTLGLIGVVVGGIALVAGVGLSVWALRRRA